MRPMACMSLFQSASWSRPLRRRVLSTLASAARRRWAISWWSISREKKRTGRLASRAAWAAMPRAKEVLPAPGRAPTITRLDGWRPAVMSSSSRWPVGTPVTASPLS